MNCSKWCSAIARSDFSGKPPSISSSSITNCGCLYRYIDLTDEVKCKIEGSQKVAKKLERLNRKQEDGSAEGSPNNDRSDESDNESEDETTINGRNSDPEVDEFPSLSSTQSQDIYNGNNGSLFSPCSDSLLSNRSCCSCSCHNAADGLGSREIRTSEAFAQTLSTGDIVITKVIFEENE